MYKIVQGSLPDNVLLWGLRSSWFAILIAFMVSMIFVAMAFFNNWKQSLLEAERVKAEMLQYKYESLQNQINPHFLFNSLNVLSDLVFEDQKKAVSAAARTILDEEQAAALAEKGGAGDR